MMGESPTRPQRLPVMPPVEVAAATLPWASSATAPTVPKATRSFSFSAEPREQPMQLLLAHRRAEVFVGDQLHALQPREFLGACAHEHHVRRVIHDQARERDRVLHMLEPGDRARAQVSCRP